MAPNASPILIFICIFAVFPAIADGLLCFQCASTSTDGSCRTDYWAFVNQSRGIADDNFYIKNCTDTKPTWDRCMIETKQQDGRFIHFHRGCHDGRTFGLDFNSTRFYNLRPNNETTCDRVKTLTCYTFCQTDLCNGPQVPPNKTDCDNVGPYDVLDAGVTCGSISCVRGFPALYVLVILLLIAKFGS